MATLPMDIESYILTKLPAKSLGRFKCVSKSWQTLISSPDFIRLHHQHARSSDTNRQIVFIGNAHTLKLHHLNSSVAPPIGSILFPCSCPQLLSRDSTLEIIASTEFFLLIRCGVQNYQNYAKLVLLNPITGSYYTLPSHKMPYRHNLQYGLCFDEANDDYKVVKIIELGNHTPNLVIHREVVIYSLKKNSWKIIEKTVDTSYYMMGDVAVSGRLLYTIFRSYINLRSVEGKIGCFDIVAEQWTNDVLLPPIHNLKNYYLGIFEGMLCVLGNDKEAGAAEGNYSVWVMKAHGVQDSSWVMLMSVVSNKIHRPIAYREGSKHELLCRYDGRFYWFNLRDGTKTMVDFYGVPGDGGRVSSGHICNGSLVHFPGGRSVWRIKTNTEQIRCSGRMRMRKRLKPKSLRKHDTVAPRHRGR